MPRRRAASFVLAASLAAGAAAALTPRVGAAFCGFYVAGADTKLLSDATVVVLMRAGRRTVLSMQNEYQGPPEAFALVIPVPVILQEGDVKVLRAELFERVESLAAPRLVEYWEQDPCPKDGAIGLGNTGLIGKGGGGGTGSGYGRGGGPLPTVVVEAEFEVGEYEIVILSATESTGLDQWLRAHEYRIPAGAEPLLRPYVAQGMKFFVARVNPKKVRFDAEGRARLSPLRFHYDSDEFALPIRLGLINAPDPAGGGKQDLLIHILAPNQRYEVANYPNVTIPTNLEVTDEVRDQFGAFYVSLFDHTLKEHPGAVVTEYSWGASACDPCPGPDAALTQKELMELGGDVITDQDLGGAAVTMIPAVQLVTPEVKGPLAPDIVRRIARAHINEVRFCYNRGLLQDLRLAGRVEIAATIDGEGNVSAAEVAKTTLSDASVSECVANATRRWRFPRPRGGEAVAAKLPFELRGTTSSGFGGRPSAFVLTRLHARYDATSLGEDLVFKTAEPIVGGRELWRASGEDGRPELERGAQPGTFNNFQGRYAIRHRWAGEIACQDPMRGLWGGPPPGVDGGEPRVAKRLRAAPRGGSLAAFVTAESAGQLALGAGAAAPDPAKAPAEPGRPAAAAEAEAKVAARAEPAGAGEPTRAAGCGCASAEGERRGPPALAALIALVALGRRRPGRGCRADQG